MKAEISIFVEKIKNLDFQLEEGEYTNVTWDCGEKFYK